VISYANPQAPTLAVFLLLPAFGVLFLRPPTSKRRVIEFALTFCAVFVLAAVPVLVVLPGFGTLIQSSQNVLQSDLTVRLAHSPLTEFFTPYLIVGALPGIGALLLLTTFDDVHPSEWAASITFGSTLLLWQALLWVGPTVAKGIPLITLYKDFIKLEIVLAVPLTILSAMTLRWALRLRVSGGLLGRAGQYVVVGVIAGLILLPLGFGTQTNAPYTTNPSSPVNKQALMSGQLGLPQWSQIPASYNRVLDNIRRDNPDTANYRVLWVPIDWRVWQESRATDVNLLVYQSDSSSAAQQLVVDTFQAIVKNDQERIASLLTSAGVKFVVVDLVDGQDRNVEPWQLGPPVLVDVFGTKALAGMPSGYKKILSNTPGLREDSTTDGWVVYRNLEWRPMSHSFSAFLSVDNPSLQAQQPPTPNTIALGWTAPQGVDWKEQSDRSIWIGTSGSRPQMWAAVSASIAVRAGASYQITGQMDYQGVVQAHAKVLWSGRVTARDATTYLATGHDGTGSVSLAQSVVAPSGASAAVIALMGGWSQGSGGFTRYSAVSVQALSAPDLTVVIQRPELVMSLQRELPNFLIEPAWKAPPKELAGLGSYSLVESAVPSNAGQGQVRLLMARDLTVTGNWAINAIPDRSGLVHFSGSAADVLTVPPAVLGTVPSGAQVVWIEYRSGDTEPANGTVNYQATNAAGVDIRCTSPSCTITNVLLVPPLQSNERASRLGYAFSKFMRTPDGHRSPVQLPGDWASVYYPPPQGFPSSAYDVTSILRAVGLMFGHLVALGGLLLGVVRRQ
jgi:hypothetical protein